MLLAKVENNSILEIAEHTVMFPESVCSVCPNTTVEPSDEWFIQNSVVRVNVWIEHDPVYEKLVVCDPYFDNGKVYTVKVVTKTQQELQENKLVFENDMRNYRNRLLQETDWRFRTDLVVSQGWKDYCQALRDIPTQEGFPFNIIWPQKPEQ